MTEIYIVYMVHCVSKNVPAFKLSVTLSNLNWRTHSSPGMEVKLYGWGRL